MKASRFANRHKSSRDMIGARLLETQWHENREVVRTSSLMFGCQQRRLPEKPVDLEQDYLTEMLAEPQVLLDKDSCTKMILVRGKAGRAERMAELLAKHRGALRAAPTMSPGDR